MRKTLCAGALLLATLNAHALEAGDIAFTAFNTDEDGWAIVALAELPVDSVIYFTENEWSGAALGAGGAFNSGEAVYTWSLGDDAVSAGEVVRFSRVNSAAERGVSLGSLSAGTGANIAGGGDSLFAYVGSDATTPAAFLAAISNEGFEGEQLSGTGLALGSSAIALEAGTRFGEYVGARSGEAAFASYASPVNGAANWSVSKLNSASVAPNLESFTIAAAVPEPESYAMMLAGLGLLAGVARRRR